MDKMEIDLNPQPSMLPHENIEADVCLPVFPYRPKQVDLELTVCAQDVLTDSDSAFEGS